MSTIDLSRAATDPRKHYAGVRMQQGRVLTDDDFNDSSAIAEEDLRRTRLHAIGAYGTPDAGFLPGDFGVVGGRCDFTLGNGNLYLGGMRLEMNSADRFLMQKDWLNFQPAVGAPVPPPDGQTRNDLVWIEAWQQPVTAVEDSELFEVALGGPDTTTRWRTMRRVHVTAGVGQADCADAWAAVTAGFAAIGTINVEMELATAATLTVTFSQPPSAGDLCSPQQAGGYLGAENEAIRVQIVDATHYTWGYRNASPLYRVLLGAKGGQMVRLQLLNQPKDAVHWPLAGQVVELLPWSAALVNGERVAEVAGHLCKVAVSYDPDDQTLEIDTPVSAGFGTQWQARSDQAEFFDGTPEQAFYYLRVWNRGDDLASPAAVPIATTALGNTGLQVSFGGGPLRAADHWIIAARPQAPDVVVPWTLLSGAPPNGIRRYRAPVALLQWSTQAGVTTASVLHDCRPPFLPLARMRNCCSVTVGDGTQSFGMFTSINAAIAALPMAGGTVCILPGRYEEAVLVSGKANVTLHGCGPRSRIVGVDAAGDAAIAVSIASSSDVLVESLALESAGHPVVRVADSAAVRISGNLVQFRDDRETFSPWPAIFAEGRQLEIEDNIVEALPVQLPADLRRIFHELAAAERGEVALAARGGIQLAGGCEVVRVAGNVIVGGAGNGITLGSILRFDDDNPNGIDLPDIAIADPCAPCDPVDGGAPSDDDDGRVRYESGGDLYDIDIVDNVIHRHGANGIAVVRFFGLASNPALVASTTGVVLVTVHRLHIVGNTIRSCLHREVAKAPTALQLFMGYGGISLAFVSDLVIDNNTIDGNGRDWQSPVCGIFVLVADGLDINHNLIRDNGRRNAEPVSAAQPGIRAGIHVWLALSLQSAQKQAQSSFTKTHGIDTRRSGIAQLRVHANQVEQPLGRALFMLGAGPMLVSDNRLVSEGAGAPATDVLATTVVVGNFGISREWNIGLLATLVYLLYFKLFGKGTDNVVQIICSLSKISRLLPGLWTRLPSGKTMFDDNQVSFLMRDAPLGFDIASTLLFSLDDVAANDNQFEFHAQLRVALADLLAFGQSVRSSDNRLAETWGRALRSILSLALMNTAADNQATHCITALGLRRAVHHNLVLADTFCPDACGNPETLVGHVALGLQMVAKGKA